MPIVYTKYIHSTNEWQEIIQNLFTQRWMAIEYTEHKSILQMDHDKLHNISTLHIDGEIFYRTYTLYKWMAREYAKCLLSTDRWCENI